MFESDFNYFTRRATEQDAAAEVARHAKAKRAHRELAARYRDLASALAEPDGSANWPTSRAA